MPRPTGDHDARDLDDVQEGLREADARLREGDRAGAFDRTLRVAQQYAEHGRSLEASAIGFRALNVDSAAFTASRVATLLRAIGDAAVPLCRRSIRQHLEAERLEAAMGMGEVLLWLDPNDDGARRELAELYVRTGRRTDALELLESTCRRLVEAERDRELLATVRLLLRLDPDHLYALRKLTQSCLRLGRTAAALAAATRIVATSAEDSEGLELLARVYVQLDRPAEALDALRRLTDAMADGADPVLVRALAWRPEPVFHRGVAHLRAHARALATTGSADPFAAVPDAPELLEGPTHRPR
jgi:tetratricopeptide (TPR) repeat protein